MPFMISALYEKLTSALTEGKLRELSLKVIDAHKAKKERLLISYADLFFPENRGNQGSGLGLFVKIIKHIHPDKLLLIKKELEEAYGKNDTATLRFYENILCSDAVLKKQEKERFAYDFSEEYRYEDYDYSDPDDLEDERDYWNEGSGDYYSDSSPDGPDFVSLLKREFLGNLNLSLDISDLQSLEGELELRERSLSDLDGLQYCRNISALDLSGNRITNTYEISFILYLSELYLADNLIDDIEPLKALSNLEILDLSGNDIEDISPLMALENLSFVDLRGNPVPEDSLLRELKTRATVVI